MEFEFTQESYNYLLSLIKARPTLKTVSAMTSTSTETDPVFSAWQLANDHHANWDTAFSWGNHASAGYLTSSSSLSWSNVTGKPTTISGYGITDALSNPMTAIGDLIVGSTVSGGIAAPSRLANGSLGAFLRAGVSTPYYFDLFGTANTFTEAQTIQKTTAAPLYATINNPQSGSSFSSMGAGVQMTSNSSTASIYYNLSGGGSVSDKTLRYNSPFGQSFFSGGTSGSGTANYYFECGSPSAFVRLLASASNPRTLMEIYNSNGGSSYVEMRLSAGGVSTSLIGKSGLLGIGNSPTAYMDIAASTTSAASLRVRSGTAPSSPNDGDIWYDGTNLKFRKGGTTVNIV